MASNPNDHVESYLRHYCDPANKFDFAVLITGPWGVGKTHFIDKFVERRASEAAVAESPSKPLRVSLNGVTIVQQIDDELFRQLHPILSSKAMRIGWSVLKKSVKATTRLELGAEQVTIDPSLPDIDLTKHFKTPNDALLIFDDVERCAMPIAEVLGYINSFVERDKFKTILIANEMEIINRDAKARSKDGGDNPTDGYSRIKEKLIGQTLELKSSAPEALDSFLNDIQDSAAGKFLRQNVGLLLDVHTQSGTENLRLLKHALWDYERLAKSFTLEHWRNEEAMKALLLVCVVLAIEVRCGRLRRDEFPSLEVSELARLLRSIHKEDDSIAGRIASRYPAVQISNSVIRTKLMASLLFEGWIDSSDVRSSLDSSQYYTTKTKPPWLVASEAWDISDDDFSAAVAKIEHQFREREFQSNGELLHIIGLRFFFSKIGAIEESADRVAAQCNECLDDLLKVDKIEEVDLSDLFKGGEIFCFERQVMSSDVVEFKAVFDHFRGLVEAVKARRLPDHGQELMDQLDADPAVFMQLLCPNQIRVSDYYNVPVLATIPVGEFVERLMALRIGSQGLVFAAFKERYRTGLLDHELQQEMSWLEDLRDKLWEKAESLTPLSRYRLRQRIISCIDPFVCAPT